MALATESPRLGGAEAPPFRKGGFVAAPQRHPACGSWHGAAVTEGFTVGAFPKYQPMWKGEGYLGNREEGIGKKSVALATESPRLGGAEAPPFRKGGFVAAPQRHPACGSWHGAAVTEGFTVGAFPKYQPMWKGEGYLGNREEGIGKKSVALATESPRLGGAEAPPFRKGGFVAAPQRLPC